MKRGILLVISAPSGCGKDTVINKLLELDDSFCYSVSATTRKKRRNETEGVSYFFVSKEKFEKMIAEKKVLEYAVYCGEYYGTPKEYVEKRLDEGKNVILKIETEGMKNIKELYPEAVTVFIAPPDMETLRSRLMSRGTESEEAINKRLKRAEEEMACAAFYDYKVYNLDNCAEGAAKEIIKIVNAVKATM